MTTAPMPQAFISEGDWRYLLARLHDLEARLSSLEMWHKPLGPGGGKSWEDPKEVDRIANEIKKGVKALEETSKPQGLTPEKVQQNLREAVTLLEKAISLVTEVDPGVIDGNNPPSIFQIRSDLGNLVENLKRDLTTLHRNIDNPITKPGIIPQR